MSTSVASVVSHFPSAEDGFSTTLASTISSGATTVPLNSVSGYANDEVAVFIVDPSDANKKQAFTGTIDTAGVQVTNVIWTSGTNQQHTAGATVVDYATATHISMVSKGILVDHSQAGAHEFTTVYDPSNTTRETLKLAGLASAVNEITITNATTGNFPTISATGEVDTGIDFENSEGEEILKLDAIASAVNEVTIKNAATGNNPSLTASGGDTNIGLNLISKGTGEIQVNGTSFSGAWTSWTPTWTSSGTAPSIGNGTLTGAYKQIGKTVHFRIKFVGGSTTTWGTGSYHIALPVAGHSGIAANDGISLSGYGEDASVAAYIPIGGRMVDATKFYVNFIQGTTGVVNSWGQTSPFTWSTGDYWSATGMYEAA